MPPEHNVSAKTMGACDDTAPFSTDYLLRSLANHLAQAEKAKQEVANAESKLEQYRKDAAKNIDAADRKIEESASKAKSGISSWFGGSK